jgi:hypothetical protein
MYLGVKICPANVAPDILAIVRSSKVCVHISEDDEGDAHHD